MTMGPAPMIITVCMSVRFGIESNVLDADFQELRCAPGSRETEMAEERPITGALPFVSLRHGYSTRRKTPIDPFTGLRVFRRRKSRVRMPPVSMRGWNAGSSPRPSLLAISRRGVRITLEGHLGGLPASRLLNLLEVFPEPASHPRMRSASFCSDIQFHGDFACQKF